MAVPPLFEAAVQLRPEDNVAVAAHPLGEGAEYQLDGQTLTVRGYLGVSLFGQDQTWTRLPNSAYAEIDPSFSARRPPARTGASRQVGSGVRTD